MVTYGKALLFQVRNALGKEDGLGTVEIVLITAALVFVAVLFRDQLATWVTGALDNVFDVDTEPTVGD